MHYFFDKNRVKGIDDEGKLTRALRLKGTEENRSPLVVNFQNTLLLFRLLRFMRCQG